MKTERPPNPCVVPTRRASRRALLRRLRSGAFLAAAAALLAAGGALAQTSSQGVGSPAKDTATRAESSAVLERLDGTAIAIIAIAVLVVVLLAWRIWLTVRRERSASPARAARPAKRRRSEPVRNQDESLDRPTMQGPTDWGYDQNKRSAVGRAESNGDARDTGMPAIDRTATQWPALGAQSVTQRGKVPPDAMGRNPVSPPSPYRTGFNPYYQGEVEHRIEVEEVADTLTQAELLVQLGDPKQAMNLLARNIRETEKPGPSVWLMLLGLYQSTGREAQYNALAEGFRTLFNADVPPWPPSDGAAARNLESYPQVIKKVLATWPRPECRTFLESLLTDDRGGSRQGFSLAAYRELLFLVEMLDVLDQFANDDERAAEPAPGTAR
jgi:hypothetical protein